MQDIIVFLLSIGLLIFVYYIVLKKRIQQEQRLLDKEEKFYDLMIKELEDDLY